MSLVKKLAGETAIYGMSTIVGRLLNVMLLPFYTRVLDSTAEYGVVVDLYANATFLMVILSYRMESAFFRYGTAKEDRDRAFSNGMISMLGSTTLVVISLFVFAQPIANFLQYPQHPEYVRWFALIMAFDCLCELPFARLRMEQRPIRFATIKMINIVINIAMNLFWLLFCPWAASKGMGWVYYVWQPGLGVAYIFLSNLIASAVTLLLLSPQIRAVRLKFEFDYWKIMFIYAAPLIISSLAGMINEMLSRAMLKNLLPGTIEQNLGQVGIFGANYKLATLITLFTQAYRYAAEPFFFRHAGDKDAMKTQADATKWFTVAAATGMLGILLYIDLVKYFIADKYHDGLSVVPILLVANLLLGMYYNFSVWYRLKDRTKLGAWISIGGAAITITLNLWLIPQFGFYSAAWVTLICYLFMSWATWWTGQKHYPVPYQMGRMGLYIGLALVGYGLGLIASQNISVIPVLWIVRTLILGVYIAFIYFFEKRRGDI